jgi:hypothetical protein
MASINLLTGTAHGKVGVLQYQSQGLKCVVRSKQPDGLTNPQAETVNKPILLALSNQYHLWAKWLLENYETDYRRPQALWNYYTKCNQDAYTKELQYAIGFQVNKHHIQQEYYPVYTFTGPQNPGRLHFPVHPEAYPPGCNIVIVRGWKSRPLPEAELVEVPLAVEITGLPSWELPEPYDDIAVFIKEKDSRRALSGFTPAAYVNEETAPFWEVPQSFLDSGVALATTGLGSATRSHSLTVDVDAIPQQYRALPMRLTFNQACGGYAQGQVEILPLSSLVDLGTDDKVFNPGEQVITWELFYERFQEPSSDPVNALPGFTPITFSTQEKQEAVKALCKALPGSRADFVINLAVPGTYLSTAKITAALAPAGALAAAIGAGTRKYYDNGDKSITNVPFASLSGNIGTVTLLDSRTEYAISEALPVNPQEWKMFDWSGADILDSFINWDYASTPKCSLTFTVDYTQPAWAAGLPVRLRTLIASSGHALNSLIEPTFYSGTVYDDIPLLENYPPYPIGSDPYELYIFDTDLTHVHSTGLKIPATTIMANDIDIKNYISVVTWGRPPNEDDVLFDVTRMYYGDFPASFTIRLDVTWFNNILAYYPNLPSSLTGQANATYPNYDPPLNEDDQIGTGSLYINNQLIASNLKITYCAV